jgi:hypothetical protein
MKQNFAKQILFKNKIFAYLRWLNKNKNIVIVDIYRK